MATLNIQVDATILPTIPDLFHDPVTNAHLILLCTDLINNFTKKYDHAIQNSEVAQLWEQIKTQIQTDNHNHLTQQCNAQENTIQQLKTYNEQARKDIEFYKQEMEKLTQHKNPFSSIKTGQIGENAIQQIIQSMYPHAIFHDVSKQTKSADRFVQIPDPEHGNIGIVIESKNYPERKSVSTADVEAFQHACETNAEAHAGIFVCISDHHVSIPTVPVDVVIEKCVREATYKFPSLYIQTSNEQVIQQAIKRIYDKVVDNITKHNLEMDMDKQDPEREQYRKMQTQWMTTYYKATEYCKKNLDRISKKLTANLKQQRELEEERDLCKKMMDQFDGAHHNADAEGMNQELIEYCYNRAIFLTKTNRRICNIGDCTANRMLKKDKLIRFKEIKEPLVKPEVTAFLAENRAILKLIASNDPLVEDIDDYASLMQFKANNPDFPPKPVVKNKRPIVDDSHEPTKAQKITQEEE